MVDREQLIVRQHDTTSLTEIYGQECNNFLAIIDLDGLVGPMFLYIDQQWHRFFLDAGVLFWCQGMAPTDDELLEGERYVNWAEYLSIIGSHVTLLTFQSSQLELLFDNGARLVLEHLPADDGTRVVLLCPP